MPNAISPHATDDHLQHGPSVSTQQVDFIDDQQANLQVDNTAANTRVRGLGL
jgi:hypothetical protein